MEKNESVYAPVIGDDANDDRTLFDQPEFSVLSTSSATRIADALDVLQLQKPKEKLKKTRKFFIESSLDRKGLHRKFARIRGGYSMGVPLGLQSPSAYTHYILSTQFDPPQSFPGMLGRLKMCDIPNTANQCCYWRFNEQGQWVTLGATCGVYGDSLLSPSQISRSKPSGINTAIRPISVSCELDVISANRCRFVRCANSSPWEAQSLPYK